MRVIVYHGLYGCDTGCCGHYVDLNDGRNMPTAKAKFYFTHPYNKDHLTFAKELVENTYGKEHVADLDWENCLVLDGDTC